jgi:hypothetical protein
MAAALWTMQNAHGKRWYQKHTRDRPALTSALAQMAPPQESARAA